MKPPPVASKRVCLNAIAARQEALAAAAGEEEAEVDPIGLLQLPSRTTPDELPAPPSPSPPRLDTTRGSFVSVSTDKMRARYAGAGHHDYDVGAVRAERPVPSGRIVYYFEMTVVNSGDHGRVAIGFGPEGFDLRRQPGWEDNSCGYHGDDGYLYQGQGIGERYGPTFTTGDTVGAGINFASQEFFFTKNGKHLGNVCKNSKTPLYPIVALHSPNEEVTVNFGQQPFVFNIEAFVLEERLKQKALFQKSSLPPNICHGIIHSYLQHYGYQDTLNAFVKESESVCPSLTLEIGTTAQEAYALNQRKVLREHIMKGEIDVAFYKLREWYPQVLQNDLSAVCFLLHSQKFIEYIRVGELVEAVNYARTELAKFLKIKSFANLLQEILALLAYEEPTESCIQHHLGMCHREFVADAVNLTVLSTNPAEDDKNYISSCLEKLMRQLTACSLENAGAGEAFDLQAELQN